MKYFKDSNQNIYAYEADGSQDHLISADYFSITKEEADEIIKLKQEQQIKEATAKLPTKEEQIAALQAQIDALKG